ncbi:MAG TPA: hypothetical protein PLL94_04860, partial [Bacteroidales bacterium]|nr:hypothetical protein [Bacteroidales bacterium]
MKAKLYISALSAVILSIIPAKVSSSDKNYLSNGGTDIVINNYYDNYDYYYTSRIYRFHRSYTAFDYYSPVYTDVYWYTYRPFTWGVSIYGGGRLGFGFAINYPVYYSGWGYSWYDYDWYYPYYGNSWYWGYNPYYYSWYSPAIININIGYPWRYNHWWRNNYWAWNRHNNWWRNDYRPFHNDRYRYYASGYSSRDYSGRDSRYDYNRDNRAGNSVRSSVPAQRNEAARKNERVNPGAGMQRNGEVRNQTASRERTAIQSQTGSSRETRSETTARRPVTSSSVSRSPAASQNRSSSVSRSPAASQSRSSSASRSPAASQSRSSSASRSP